MPGLHMSFVADIFASLQTAGEKVVLVEAAEPVKRASGAALLKMVAAARAFLRGRGLQKSDLVALLAANSVEWVAINLATIAEGLIVVPLYARQAPAELAAMMRDCSPSLMVCGDRSLQDAISSEWTQAPAMVLIEEAVSG